MPDALVILQQRFRDRVSAPAWWTYAAFTASRLGAAVLLAVLPGALLLAVALVAPSSFARAATSPQNVHETFARFVSAIATASAIAVSVAQLSLGRELRGVGKQEERGRANDEYRDRVRAASGRASAPLALGPFLGVAAESVGEAARRAREAATREELAARVEGAALGEYLDAIEAASVRGAAKVRSASRQPIRLAAATLEFEEEVSAQLARRFARDERLSTALRSRVEDLRERLRDVVLGSRYAKTLGTQWGLSRMSMAIALASLPAIVTATAMTLLYGEGAREALGAMGTLGLVGAALAVVLFPLALFVSHIVRFIFLNEHTLPTDAFVLGPEEVAVLEDERAGRPSRPGRPA